MAGGSLQVAVDKWQVAVGNWLLAGGGGGVVILTEQEEDNS